MITNHQTAQIDHYAVMGNPIAHSQSPFIHTAFAEQTGQNVQYDAILVGTETGEFAEALEAFQATGGKGLNITVPFKQDAYALTKHCTERAERAGAVNTLWFDEQNGLIGDNTDGVGLVRDLTQNHGYDFAGQRVLILGAGGAVRGVLGPILEAAPVECVIANRTVSKAETLATLFAPLGPVKGCAYEALAGQTYDLIINGTSASLQGQLPPLPEGLLAQNGWCYDMMYANRPTLFIEWAQEQSAAAAYDGLGMLVEQAAEAFYQWREIRPETVPVIQQVREFRLK